MDCWLRGQHCLSLDPSSSAASAVWACSVGCKQKSSAAQPLHKASQRLSQQHAQATTSPPESLLLLEASSSASGGAKRPDDEEALGGMFLHMGLANGVLLRTEVRSAAYSRPQAHNEAALCSERCSAAQLPVLTCKGACRWTGRQARCLTRGRASWARGQQSWCPSWCLAGAPCWPCLRAPGWATGRSSSMDAALVAQLFCVAATSIKL